MTTEKKWIVAGLFCATMLLGFGLSGASIGRVASKQDGTVLASRYPLRARTPDFFERTKTSNAKATNGKATTVRR